MTVQREEQTGRDHVHPALAAVDWAAFRHAWERYDDIRFRPQVERVLGADAFDDWKGFTQALLSGEPPGEYASFEDYADAMVGRLFEAAKVDDPEGHAARRAFTAVYLYFAILAGWELSDRYEALEAMVSALEKNVRETSPDLPATHPPRALDPHEAYDAVTAAARDLATTLRPQFRWENALFCSCPVAFAKSAKGAVEGLEPLVGTGGSLAQLDRALAGHSFDLHTMVSVLLDSTTGTMNYACFLRDHAAPASETFVDVLSDRGAANTASVTALLEAAEERAGTLSENLEGNVFASEARAFGDGFRRMVDGLRSPSLTIEEGEIVLLFPFGMPTVDAVRLVRDLVQPGEPRDGKTQLTVATLLGLPVSAHELPMTNTFASFGARTVTEQPTIGARLIFHRDRLMLDTTADIRVLDVDLEIRIGSLGNHCVRVAVTTDHKAASTNVDAPSDDAEDGSGAWTAHDVDQWVRRAGYEVGTETIWFERIRHTDERPDVDDQRPTYGQVVELAEELVADLHEQLLTQLGGDDMPEDRDVNDLHANARVVIVAGRVNEHPSDGSQPVALADPKRLPELLGSQALLLPQRSLATTLEEWVRYDPDPPANLLDGLGLPDDLLAVNGDVTLLCALGSPSWAVVEIQQLVEFAVSVVGPLAAWAVWSRYEATSAAESMTAAATDDDMETVFTESARVARSIGRIRALLDHLRSAQLMRGHRDRELLRRFMDASGVDTLEQSLDASTRSLLAQRSFGAAHVERIVEQQQKRRDGFLGTVLAFIAIFGLAELFAWLRDALDWHHGFVVVMELGVLAVLTVVLILFVRRRASGRKRGGHD